MIIKRLYSTTNKNYDIIIVGGGMIGSVLANILASIPVLSDRSILLLEGAKEKSWKNDSNYSNRVSTINSSTKTLLKSVDLWDTIRSRRCKPVYSMKISGNSSDKLVTTFDSADNVNPNEPLAYVIENDVIITSAFESLKKYGDRVKVLYNSSVTDIALPPNKHEYVRIKMKDGLSFSCQLLLGSDGYNSLVRNSMQVQYLSWNYNQQAIVATLELSENSGNSTAWQKFLAQGPVALLPLTENMSSLVWMMSPKRAKQLLSLSDESFVDELNSALWEPPVSDPIANNINKMIDLGFEKLRCLSSNGKEEEIFTPPTIKSIYPGSRASFPVGFGHSTQYVKPRVALVGDAAHRVNPLAGQGVNIGFSDVKVLTDALEESIFSGSDLDDYEMLKRYERTCLRNNVPKLIGIDVIQKVGGHTWTPLLVLNHFAYNLTNAISPLKKLLISRAEV